MAKKIKKSFFKVLPWSVVMLMIISITLGVWYSLPVQPAKAAALAPLTVTYRDADANGTVDNIRLTFTNVTACTYEAGDWAVGVAGTINVTAITGFTNSASCTTDEYIDVAVTTTANITGGAVNPRIDYTDAVTAGSVVADGNQDAANFTATDAAAPVYYSSTTLDNNGDGTVDYIKVTYTESILDSSVAAADYEAGIADTTAGNLIESFASLTPSSGYVTDVANDANIYVGVTSGTETIAALKTDYNLKIQQVGAVTDSIPNSLASFTTKSSTDGAAPILIGGQYSDDDADGQVDFLKASWSESVTTSGSTAVDWTITGGSINAAFVSVSDFVSVIQVPIAITADLNETGGAVDPTVAYDNDDANNSVVDGAANAARTTGPVAISDAASPIGVSAAYKDIDADGTVERIDVTMSADVGLTCTWDAGDWFITDAGTILATIPSNCAVSGNDIQITISASPGATGGAVNPAITYSNIAPKGSVHDGAMNNSGSFPLPLTATDAAAPVIMTTSPANNASEVAVAASVVVTFSEPMTTGSVTYTLLPNPGGLAVGWTVGNTVATYTHTAFDSATLFTFRVTAANAAAGSPNALIAGPVQNPFTFTTLIVGGGGGGTTAIPDSLTVTAPNGGESWAGNSSHNIVWASTGSNVSKVKLLYSLDSGINFSHVIATNENNDGSYSWTVPNVATSTAKVKIEGYDSSGVLVTSDISDANFTITYVTPTPGTPETPTTPTTPETPLNELQTGDLLKSPLSTTVYYYGSDQKRHIFPNEKTYKSWYADFASVKSVSAETLQAIPLGNNVTVRAGTFLVKIQTDPKVYAVEPNGLLRWVPTEARAIALYGSAWATKVIDVPVIFWVDYTFGTDITTDQHPTGALVKYASSADVYYVQNAQKRKVSSAGFTANHFQDAFVLTIPTTISYVAGTDVATAENAISRIY